MNNSFRLPPPDYERIYQVIYSVLETYGNAITHRACFFFAAAGALILREHYDLKPTISSGCMALMVDELNGSIAIYGKEENGQFTANENAFHAWVECEGWLIDFMAPLMDISYKKLGRKVDIPAKMLQKPLTHHRNSPRSLQRNGDFYIHNNSALTHLLLEEQSNHFEYLVNVCLEWFKRPPFPLPEFKMLNYLGSSTLLGGHAPKIVGHW